ncbi:MAG: molybdenum cofactor guanylyltransferase [Clostridia bacterium]|jgi:molybdopterin-guanine dinucleotide biosynthesis protein A|nr:molybdenum cofactor guanylyltransferase [Clostridia bacterium]
MKLTDTAIILAGGLSRRMGEDKRYIKLHDQKTLLDHVISNVEPIFPRIIIADDGKLEYKNKPNIITVQDVVPQCGLLSGIHSGLCASEAEYAYVIACDMPYLNPEYIEYMSEQVLAKKPKACVTRFGVWIEPANAFYHKSLTSLMHKYLLAQRCSVYPLLQKVDTLFITEKKAREFSPDWQMFFNLNTKADVENYLNYAETNCDY